MIVAPHHALKDAVVAAVESGCPVLVEKPMAVSRAEAEEIRQAASILPWRRYWTSSRRAT